jgi:hypothetical protein
MRFLPSSMAKEYTSAIAKPPHVLRALVSSSAGIPTQPSTMRALPRAASDISRIVMSVTAKGPHEFIVLLMRMPNGTGCPSDSIFEEISQNASHGIGETNSSRPYTLIRSPP